MAEQKETKNPVQSAERIFQVMEMLADHGEMGLMEISTALGLHKSTVHRLLMSLVYMGYAKQDEVSQKYMLSYKIVSMAGKMLDRMDILQVAKPYMERLSDISGETVHLVQREGNNILYIYKYAYSDTLRYDDKIAQGTSLESYEFENLYRSCMEYMNMLEDTDGYMYRNYKSCDTQEKEIISTWTQHVKAVLTDTIGQSEADYAADYQALYGNGDVSNYNMFREKAQKYEK